VRSSALSFVVANAIVRDEAAKFFVRLVEKRSEFFDSPDERGLLRITITAAYQTDLHGFTPAHASTARSLAWSEAT